MNYKLVLEKLGLVEGVDFQLTETSFEMLQKSQMVEITPAVVDEEGNVVSEAVMEEQFYTPQAPSQQSLDSAWEEVQLDQNDIVLLIEEYLSDKSALRDPEEDSINIVNNRIFEWRFANIPQPTNGDLVASIAPMQVKKAAKEAKEAKLQAGKMAREACIRCLDLIAGYNLEQSLTSEQITEMQTVFAPIQSALMTSRPTLAKTYITALTPDEVLVTQELKDMVLAELANY